MPAGKPERHVTGRIGWLRAAVLGANDGILSTSSLVLGVAAAHATHSNVLVAGVAGLVAGAMSMVAGEYVSVHSQADTEQAELELERAGGAGVKMGAIRVTFWGALAMADSRRWITVSEQSREHDPGGPVYV